MAPSGWLINASCAVRLNVGPTIPGVAACEAVAVNAAAVIASTWSSRRMVNSLKVFRLIAALLVNPDFRH